MISEGWKPKALKELSLQVKYHLKRRSSSLPQVCSYLTGGTQCSVAMTGESRLLGWTMSEAQPSSWETYFKITVLQRSSERIFYFRHCFFSPFHSLQSPRAEGRAGFYFMHKYSLSATKIRLKGFSRLFWFSQKRALIFSFSLPFTNKSTFHKTTGRTA